MDPRRGHPLLQADIPERRLYAFGAIYTASDTVLILILLLSLAFALFFFTSLFGRLWCGYACPQTVFLEELIRPIEQFFEGDRNARMKRDAGPLTADRVLRRLGKWVVFALVALSGPRRSWGTSRDAQRSSGPGGPVPPATPSSASWRRSPSSTSPGSASSSASISAPTPGSRA